MRLARDETATSVDKEPRGGMPILRRMEMTTYGQQTKVLEAYAKFKDDFVSNDHDHKLVVEVIKFLHDAGGKYGQKAVNDAISHMIDSKAF